MAALETISITSANRESQGTGSTLIRCTVAICLAFSVASCGREPPTTKTATPSGVATGTIVIEVFVRQSNSYWRYRVTPSSGQVMFVAAATYRQDGWSDPKPRTGLETCDKAVTSPSPDGRFVARCLAEAGGWRTQFTITSGDREVFTWKPLEAHLVDGFAWSPDSRSMAMLNHTYRRGTGPLERLWAYLGHPVFQHTFYLSIIDVASGRSVDYLVKADVTDGEAKIQDWSR